MSGEKTQASKMVFTQGISVFLLTSGCLNWPFCSLAPPPLQYHLSILLIQFFGCSARLGLELNSLPSVLG